MTTRSAHCHPGDSVLGVFSLQEAGHGSKFNLVQLSTSLQKKKKNVAQYEYIILRIPNLVKLFYYFNQLLSKGIVPNSSKVKISLLSLTKFNKI